MRVINKGIVSEENISITRGPLYTGIISPNKLLLVLCFTFSLAESETSLSSHSLSCSNLFDGFLESANKRDGEFRV